MLPRANNQFPKNQRSCGTSKSINYEKPCICVIWRAPIAFVLLAQAQSACTEVRYGADAEARGADAASSETGGASGASEGRRYEGGVTDRSSHEGGAMDAAGNAHRDAAGNAHEGGATGAAGNAPESTDGPRGNESAPDGASIQDGPSHDSGREGEAIGGEGGLVEAGRNPSDGGAGPCVGIAIKPGVDVQAAINKAPGGSVFCFGAGTYQVSSLAPKSGDVFDGASRAAILDGRGRDRYAFSSSSARDVTIRGFVIQKYATPLQEGAIHSFGTTGWTIENNHITHNGGCGVATDSGARVLGNLIDWNDQQGFCAHGEDILYDGNEIAYNNHELTVDATWEAGGGKAWATVRATFRNNFVHDNGGNGLWTDTNNIYTVYDHNTVINNWGAGIYHEISYDAKITNNVVSGNGMPSSPGGGQKLGWLFDAGIQIRQSQSLDAASPLLIADNTVTDNYNGITLIESPPSGCTNGSLGEGAYGPCAVKNVLVQNNVVSMSQGATGAAQDGAGPGVFTSQNNRFVGNTYTVTASHPDLDYAYGWFAWKDNWNDWAQWQAHGNDAAGSYVTR